MSIPNTYFFQFMYKDGDRYYVESFFMSSKTDKQLVPLSSCSVISVVIDITASVEIPSLKPNWFGNKLRCI